MTTKKYLKRAMLVAIIASITIPMLSASVKLVNAETTTDLKVTPYNLCVLLSYPSYAYYNGRLFWCYGVQLDATCEKCFGSYYTQHGDNNGYYWGQCVSSIKALCKNNAVTSTWIKGPKVIGGNVAPGTAIATFDSSGHYYGHTAILCSYISGGITVWDQNWYTINGMGIFGKHSICNTGTGGVTDANSYYVIKIPC